MQDPLDFITFTTNCGWWWRPTERVGGRMGVNCNEKADPAAASSLLSRE